MQQSLKMIKVSWIDVRPVFVVAAKKLLGLEPEGAARSFRAQQRCGLNLFLLNDYSHLHNYTHKHLSTTRQNMDWENK